MRRALLVFLLVAGASASHAPSGDTPPVVGSLTITPGDADLYDARGTDIEFLVHVDDDGGADAVVVVLTHPDGRSIDVFLDPVGYAPGQGLPCKNCDWAGTLPVNTQELTKGKWTALVIAADGQGHSVSSEGGELNVVLGDPASHPLELIVLGHPPGTDGKIPEVDMRPADTLDLLPGVTGAPELLRKVSFTLQHGLNSSLDISVPRLLPAPYQFTTSQFADGPQLLVVKVHDRADRVTTVDIPLLVDTTPPLAVMNIRDIVDKTTTPRPTTYVGVPFKVDVAVADLTKHEVTVALDGQRQSSNSTGAVQLHTFTFERDREGNGSLRLTVVDRLGNRFDSQFNVTTIHPVTDSKVAVKLDIARPLRGDNLTFTVTASQKNGIVELPFEVTLGGILGDAVHEVVLPSPGSEDLDPIVMKLPPGRYVATSHIDGVVPVTERVDDQWGNHSFEVYTGAVKYRNDTYYIQVDAAGFPCRAVKSLSGAPTTCNLRLREQGFTEIYAFDMDGRSLYWDPAAVDKDGRPVTDLTPKDKQNIIEKAPGPVPALVGLALLGAALLRRR